MRIGYHLELIHDRGRALCLHSARATIHRNDARQSSGHLHLIVVLPVGLWLVHPLHER
jgi:hypothetical protein